MLSESQAQDLLRAAGDTIDVDPAGPLDTALASRRRWPVIAAAAAVVLVAGGLTVGLRGNGDTQRPPPADSTTIPVPDTGDAAFRLGPDQIPAVLGLTEESARALLEERGMTVAVRYVPTCDASPNHAVSTEPGTGTLTTPGDSATLVVSNYALGNCVAPIGPRSIAVQLLMAATNEDQELPSSAGVDLAPALDRLRTWASEVGRYGPRFTSPELIVAQARRDPRCTPGLDTTGAGEWFTVNVYAPAPARSGLDSIFHCPIAMHLLGLAGPIDRLIVPPSHTPMTGVADVVGNSVAFATERLEAQGYVVELGHCGGGPTLLVSAQAPTGGEDAPPGSTVYLDASTYDASGCTAPQPAASASAAADAFLAFARGGPAPVFADAVRVSFDDERLRTLVGDERDDLAVWTDLCPRTARCVIPRAWSPTFALATYDGPVAVGVQPSSCPAHPHPESLDVDGFDLVTLSPADEPVTCNDAWTVEIYLDDLGRIAAVDLLGAHPEPSVTDD